MTTQLRPPTTDHLTGDDRVPRRGIPDASARSDSPHLEALPADSPRQSDHEQPRPAPSPPPAGSGRGAHLRLATRDALPGRQALPRRAIPEGQLPDHVREALPRVVAGAVDVFDAAARLEAQGMGDVVARQAGYASTFDHARALLQGITPPKNSSTPSTFRRSVLSAVLRGFVMLIGVLICVLAVPADRPALHTFAAGGAAWFSAQTVSAAIWWGLGQRQEGRGATLALAISVFEVLVGLAFFTIMGSPELATWVMWGSTAAVWLSRRRLTRSLWLTLAALGIALIGLGLDGPWRVTPAILALGAGYAISAGQLLHAVRTQPNMMIDGWHRVLVMACIQTLAPVTMLWVAAGWVGPEFLVVALGSMVASAASDPLVEIASQAVRRIADRGLSWRTVRRRTAMAGVLVTAGAALGGLGAGLLASYLLRGIPPGLPAISITLAVSTFSVGGALLLRTGDARGATWLALVSSGLLALVLASTPNLPGWLFIGIDLFSVAVIGALAARRLSSPQVW
ncbi:hypothetical protein ACTQ49_12990 [Luteococcus sp. Sow4_B9]|uniref:hypothetical protein n=1 Tax=Luteococcus sp. Sow4_B9 TaxID=3438792 RepID=UPI003F9E4539